MDFLLRILIIVAGLLTNPWRTRHRWLLVLTLLVTALTLLPTSHPLTIRLRAAQTNAWELLGQIVGEPTLLRYQTFATLAALHQEIDRLAWLESEATVKAQRWSQLPVDASSEVTLEETNVYRRTSTLYTEMAANARNLRQSALGQQRRLEAHLALLDAATLWQADNVAVQRVQLDHLGSIGHSGKIEEIVQQLQTEIERYGRIVEGRNALQLKLEATPDDPLLPRPRLQPDPSPNQ